MHARGLFSPYFDKIKEIFELKPVQESLFSAKKSIKIRKTLTNPVEGKYELTCFLPSTAFGIANHH